MIRCGDEGAAPQAKAKAKVCNLRPKQSCRAENGVAAPTNLVESVVNLHRIEAPPSLVPRPFHIKLAGRGMLKPGARGPKV